MAIQLQESKQIITTKHNYNVSIKIPYVLREKTDDQKEIDIVIRGFQPTIRRIIYSLIEVYPSIREHFLNKDEEIPACVSYYLNSINLKNINLLDTTISDNHNVLEVRACLAGG